MVLSTEERIFLIKHVFRANGEYTKAVKWAFPAVVVTLFLFFFNKLREGHCSSHKIDYLKYFVIDF